MKNYRVTLDIQMDSDETASAFAVALCKTIPIAAGSAVDISNGEDPRIKLGETILKSCAKFKPQ